MQDLTDEDQDTIADRDEGRSDATDTDADGDPDYLDGDSDDDGLSDAVEAGDDEVGTPPVDTDRDGVADFRDLDSDNDGLSDAEETRGTSCLDPTDVDSDDDGQTDLAEITAGSDPCDADSKIEEFFFVLPFGDPSGLNADTLTFDTSIRRADIHLNVDTTSSMNEEIDNLQTSLARTIVPSVRALIPDVAFGVSEFEDFPVNGFGEVDCAGGSDLPFRLLIETTTDVPFVDGALRLLDMPLGCGGDVAESGFESLYQIAAGDGVDFPGGNVPPFMRDPRVPGGGEIGGVGFREGSFPIVIHVTDDVSHVRSDYVAAGISEAHSREQAVTGLQQISARLIGISTRSDARAQLVDLALDTGAFVAPVNDLCSTGVMGMARPPEMQNGEDVCALVFDARSDGTGLSETLVDAVDELVTAIQLRTVNIRVVDDEQGFIKAAIPRSAEPPAGAPPATIADLDGDTIFDSFIDVTPGTVVSFSVQAFNDAVQPTEVDQVFTARLQVIGDGVAVLDELRVVIIVPGQASAG